MKKFSEKFRVYYEDTDAGGVVYYANFLKFAERARTDMLRLSGMGHTDIQSTHNAFFVVRKAEIEYLAPGRLDDLLDVTCEIIKVGRSSLDMKQECINQNGVKLADIFIQIVCVTNDGGRIKSVKIPESILKHYE